jgi:hypothetical protein
MRRMRGAVLLLALLGLGCAGAITPHGGAGQPPDSSRPGPPGGGSSDETSSIQARPKIMPSAPALSTTVLGNAMYPCEQVSGGTVQLADGKYSEDVASASGNQLRVTLSDKMAFGDLDGDGNNDAALILIADRGGEGVFYNLEAVVNVNGVADPRTAYVLGDRVRINSVIILENEILVDLTRRGPHDAPNAPTVRFKERYSLRGRQLELLESKQYR